MKERERAGEGERARERRGRGRTRAHACAVCGKQCAHTWARAAKSKTMPRSAGTKGRGEEAKP
eukprot:1091146-Rhodomonas_salina.1